MEKKGRCGEIVVFHITFTVCQCSHTFQVKKVFTESDLGGFFFTLLHVCGYKIMKLLKAANLWFMSYSSLCRAFCLFCGHDDLSCPAYSLEEKERQQRQL